MTVAAVTTTATRAPGPRGRDMVRAVPSIRRDAPGFLLACARRWGPVVAFPVPTPTFLVSDPAAVRRVLQDNHRGYDKSTVQYRSLAAVTGNGLLASDGEPWRAQRRLVAPAFHHRTLAGVGARTAEAASRRADAWSALPDGSVVDVDAAMMQTTLDVVGHALFSTDLGAAVDTDRLLRAVLDGLDVVVARSQSPLPDRLAWRRTVRLERSRAVIDAAVATIVASRRDGGTPAEPDLLDLLLGAEEGGDRMDDRALRDEIVTLVIAGHETVAAALTWAWHLLGTDPVALSALSTEVDHVLGSRPPRFEDLAALPYTRAVLDEALRLYPPAWVITRRCLDGDILSGVEIPAGALVITSPWVVHRDPTAWPDPSRFDPTRFLPQHREQQVRSAYLPFGAGPRLCVGREFALAEATLVLATLASRFRLAPVPGHRVRPHAQVTVRPHGGLPMRLHRR